MGGADGLRHATLGLRDPVGGALRAGVGETDLHLDAGYRPQVVDGILTGMHATAETHFALLGAFAPRDLLGAALTTAEENGFLTHEPGDTMLVLSGALAATQVAPPTPARPRDQVVRIE